MISKRKLAFLAVMTLILAGCSEKTENQELIDNAALVTTCQPNISIYQWHDKLYYREQSSYKLRQVIAKLDDVCAKFQPAGGTAIAGKS